MSHPIGTICMKRRWSAPRTQSEGRLKNLGARGKGGRERTHVLEPSVPAHLNVVHVIEQMGKPQEETSSDRCVNEMPVRAGEGVSRS